MNTFSLTFPMKGAIGIYVLIFDLFFLQSQWKFLFCDNNLLHIIYYENNLSRPSCPLPRIFCRKLRHKSRRVPSASIGIAAILSLSYQQIDNVNIKWRQKWNLKRPGQVFYDSFGISAILSLWLKQNSKKLKIPHCEKIKDYQCQIRVFVFTVVGY